MQTQKSVKKFLGWFGSTALVAYTGYPPRVATYEELGLEPGPSCLCVMLQERYFPRRELRELTTFAEARGLPEALTHWHAALGLLTTEEGKARRDRAVHMQGMRYPKHGGA